MGIRFRKSVKIAPGIRVNFGKKGSSISLGGRGATVNINKNGTRTTVGIPGTGLSYSEYKKHGHGDSSESSVNEGQKLSAKGIVIAIVIILFFLWLVF